MTKTLSTGGRTPHVVSLRARLTGALLALPFTGAFAADWIYTVRPGDSVWSVTQDYLEGTRYFARLKEYNNLTDTSTVGAGTKLRIPVNWLKAQPASAEVTRATGTVERTPANGGEPVPVAAGDALQIGDQMSTGPASRAVLGFADGSRMLVLQNTSITFDSLGAFGDTGMVDTTMRLHTGRVENEVITARGAASRFEITTPSAVAAVRGTDFRAAYDEAESEARVEVGEGRVGVDAERDSVSLDAGFGIIASLGEPLPPPVALLPAVDLAGLPNPLERELWLAEWPALAGAVAYRVRLYAASDLESAVRNEIVTEPGFEWNAPPDGGYVLRVRGIDAQDLEGLDGELPLDVNARPVPPPPLRPEDAARIPEPLPAFGWARPETTESVRLQVALDEDFNNLLVDETGLSELEFQPPELPPGDYYWRLGSTGAEGEGPWGDARELAVLPVPEAVEAAPPEVAGRAARLTWGRTANTVAYDFEIADNPEFEDPVVSETLDAPEYRWESPGPGTFYYRARGVSDEGVKGPYGPANQLEMPFLSFDPVFRRTPSRDQ